MTDVFTPVPLDAVSGDLTTLGTVVTQVLTWFGNALTTISTTPILLVGMGMYVVGGAIGLTRRALKGR